MVIVTLNACFNPLLSCANTNATKKERARTQELNAKTAEEARAVKLGNQAAAKGKL
jgi:hypothetical protein